MPPFMPDTHCILAALSPWHEHHRRALQEMDRRLDRSDSMVLAAHTLIEAYSVVTRWPEPHRVTPAMARRLLHDNVIQRATVVALSSIEYLSLLNRSPEARIAGGQVYDALIAACTLKAGAVLLAFNLRHFQPFRVRGLAVVVPGVDTT